MAAFSDPMQEFRAQLSALRARVGEPSYETLNAASDRVGKPLPTTTANELLTGSRSPRWSTVEKFLLACKEHARSTGLRLADGTFDLTRWRTKFNKARGPSVQLDGGPLRDPYRAADTAETPVQLLRAEYAVVPFQNRDELTVLRAFCEQVAEGVRTGLAVVHGVGGAGKTRLALELAHRQRAEGWYAGVLPKDAANVASLVRVPAPVLVVLDYADGRVDEVIALFKALRERSGPRAVVVLTARTIEGQWLTEIVGSLDDDRHTYRREEIGLPDKHPDSHNIYLRTVAVLRPACETPPALPTPARGIRWTTLDLVLLGWIAASGATTLPSTRGRLYDEALRHEENYWCTVYAHITTQTKPERSLLRKAAACLSLVAPTETQVDAVLNAVKDLANDAVERRTVRRSLEICLSPGPGEGLAVRPDPIGDHLLLRELGQDKPLLHATLVSSGEDCLEQAVVALTRAGQNDAEASIRLITALAEANSNRWHTILMVAADRAGAALTAMERLAARPDTPLPLDELSAALPFSTLALFDLALIVDQHRLTKARAEGVSPARLSELLVRVSVRADKAGDRAISLALITEAVKHYRDLARIDAVSYVPNLAGSLTNLGIQLSELGHQEHALAVSQEADGLYRDLVATNPATYLPYLPYLAASLNNLGIRLSELGRREQALAPSQEATDLYRDLVATNPATYLPYLAASLNNLGMRLAELGRREQALAATREAADLRRGLAAADPTAYLPALAASLNNLGMRLAELGRREQALASSQEAADLYRDLVAANPAAYLPDLAMSLNNLGIRLSELGGREQALASSQEATDLYHDLVATNPIAHLPHLAMSLNNLGVWLWELGSREQALGASQQAADLRQDLVASRPAAHLPDLATSLNNVGFMLSELGSREQALGPSQKAVDIRRELATINPAAYLPDLAMSLNNLGVVLANLGRREHAATATQDAVGLYRELATTNPDANLPHFAMSLNNLGNQLSELGHHEQALTSSQEAVGIYRELATTYPDANLATALTNLGNRLSEMGHPEQALAATQEAASLYRELAATNPDAYLPNLATLLTNLGNQLWELGRREHALKPSQEAVNIRWNLATGNPTPHLRGLAISLDNLGFRLSELGHPHQALAATQKAADLFRGLATTNPAGYLPNLARSLDNLGFMLSELDHSEQALAATQEAVNIRRKLATTYPDANLATALTNLGNRLSEMGHPEQALAATQEAVDLRRELATTNPTAYLPNLAISLNNLGNRLWELGRHEHALKPSQEAVNIRRELARTNAAYLPDLAGSLNNLGIRLANLGHPREALAPSQEAVELHRELAATNPAAYLPNLAMSLNNLSDRFAEGRDGDAAVTAWHDAIGAMSHGAASAEMRAWLAGRLAAVGLVDQAGEELRRAAQEIDDSSPGEAVDRRLSVILVGRARLAVRSAVRAMSQDVHGLPVWATAPLPHSHVDLVNAIGEATGWPSMRAVLDEHRDIVASSDLRVSLHALATLYPDRTAPSTFLRLLDDIADEGIEAVFQHRQAEHDRQALLNAWMATPTWAESATFYREYEVALDDDACWHRLAGIDDNAARQHLAILYLARELSIDDAFAMVADPSAAEEAVYDAIEHGALDRLCAIARAAPGLQARQMCWGLLMAVLMLAQRGTDEALDVGRQIAEQGTPILRRAHTVSAATVAEAAS